MKRLLCLVLLSALVLGCQSESRKRKYWSKPTTTIEQAKDDCRKCEVIARGEAQARQYIRYGERAVNRSTAPFTSPELNEIDREFDERHSFRSCMRSLGYRPIPGYRLGSDVRKAYRFGGGTIQHLAGD